MENTRVIFDTILFLLLTGVAGLMVWLHYKFKQILKSNKEVPVLSNMLSNNMSDARNALSELSGAVRNKAPELDKKIMEANRTIQEITFVLAKAEKVMKQFDTRLDAIRELKTSANYASSMDNNKKDSAGDDKKALEELLGKSKTSAATPKVNGNTKEQRTDHQKWMSSHKKIGFKRTASRLAANAYKNVGSNATVTEAEEDLRKAFQERL